MADRKDDIALAEHRGGKPGEPHEWRRGRRGYTRSVVCHPPVVLDLDDPFFDGQTLPDAVSKYTHVHSTTGVCVKAVGGRFCPTRLIPPTGHGSDDE